MVRTCRTQLQGLQDATKQGTYEDCGTGNATPAAVGKTRSKEKTKRKPQVPIREPLDPNRVFVKVNGHRALALIDLQTIGGDLISAQFVYLYKLPVVKIEPKTLATAIKGSKGTVDKTCEVELN